MKRNDCIEVLDHLKEKLKEKDIIAVQDSEDNYNVLCAVRFLQEKILLNTLTSGAIAAVRE